MKKNKKRPIRNEKQYYKLLMSERAYRFIMQNEEKTSRAARTAR